MDGEFAVPPGYRAPVNDAANSPAATRPRPARKDRRPLVVVVAVISIAILAQLFSWWDQQRQDAGVTPLRQDPLLEEARARVEALAAAPALPALADPAADPAAHASAARLREIDDRFRQSAAMLHAGRHELAVSALHRVLELAPMLPEAHANMGFALLGLERPEEALAFFVGAADLKPELNNAYYGMALAHEALGDLRLAVETMETYLHLERAESYLTRRAAAAVWEWRARLDGVPMTPEELAAAQQAAANDAGAATPDTVPVLPAGGDGTN
jgi:tetratricopeptide (TPR) repeat protein